MKAIVSDDHNKNREMVSGFSWPDPYFLVKCFYISDVLWYLLSFCSTDINECATSNACPTGICTNTEGSYICTNCQSGFIKSPDGQRCEGTFGSTMHSNYFAVTLDWAENISQKWHNSNVIFKIYPGIFTFLASEKLHVEPTQLYIWDF